MVQLQSEVLSEAFWKAHQKQRHRLGLFIATWSIAGLFLWCFAYKNGWRGNDIGEFDEAVKLVTDWKALLLGASVPAVGAFLAFLATKFGPRWMRAEGKRDMEELGNDVVAVLYNGLSATAAVMVVCAFQNILDKQADWSAWSALFICLDILTTFVVAYLSTRSSIVFPELEGLPLPAVASEPVADPAPDPD